MLSFMQGAAINDWVLQQTERLYLKCNGNLANGIPLTYHTDDEWRRIKFGRDFKRAFADMASKQRAYGELAKFTIGNKSINKYIA